MPTLEWIGKKAVLNHHREVPFHLLKTDPKLSVGDPDSGNLLVQGDNLLALKALLPYYAGQVKCIYIDPPYNTGNENWVYNDAVNSPEIQEWIGKVVGAEAEDLSRHDKWLCMMYPRLSLLRQFLREDGVIFASIDDNELEALRYLIHDIFGRTNMLATLVWERSKKGDSKLFSVSHEYMVVAAKSKQTLTALNTRWRKFKPGVEEVMGHYSQLVREFGGEHGIIRREMMKWYRSLPKGHPAKAHKHYNWSDDRGLYFAADFSGPDDGRPERPRHDIVHPVTGKPCKKPRTGWRWDEERTKSALADDPPRIHFGKDETTIPCRKSYLAEISEEPFQSVFYQDGRRSSMELDQMVGKGKFQYPKDSDLLAEIIGMVCGPSDLVLDSFAGSGTTGHAVLKLNSRENVDVRFILVEIEADIAAEVTKERLAKAIDGYKPITRKKAARPVAGLGGGFTYCTLATPLFCEDGSISQEVKFPDLAAHVYFVETGAPLPNKANGKTPLLGVHNGVAVYLLFNGVLGDKRVNGGNVLTTSVLNELSAHNGPRVIYGDGCRLSAARLRREGIVFKQIPYQIKVI